MDDFGIAYNFRKFVKSAIRSPISLRGSLAILGLRVEIFLHYNLVTILEDDLSWFLLYMSLCLIWSNGADFHQSHFPETQLGSADSHK